MNNPVLYLSELIGTTYRGEVVEAVTFKVLFKTPFTYPTEKVAQLAACRLYAERTQGKQS